MENCLPALQLDGVEGGEALAAAALLRQRERQAFREGGALVSPTAVELVHDKPDVFVSFM